MGVDLPAAGTIIGGHYGGAQFDVRQATYQLTDAVRSRWAQLDRDRGEALMRAAGYLVRSIGPSTSDAQQLLGVQYGLTGHVTELPFLTYTREYDLAPKFLTQSETPGKHYSNAAMETTHNFELANYRRIRALPPAKAVFGQLKYFVGHCLLQPFMGFALLLLGLPWACIRKRKKWLVLLLAASVAAMLPEVWIQFHYTAPFTIISVILIVASALALWYRLAVARFRGPVFALCLVILFGPLLFHYMGVLRPRTNLRSSVVRQLESLGGSHLVFVNYRDDWNFSHEWVYNGASLESAPVLFAHDLGSAKDRELVEQYRARTAWMLRLGPQESDVSLERFAP
jgi:hypothetical protein